MLRFDRKQQNSVKQLSFNKKIFLKRVTSHDSLERFITNHIISTQRGTKFEKGTRAETESAPMKFTKEKILRKT